MLEPAKAIIENGQATLGCELGSTRIKAILVDASGRLLASGSQQWENRLEHGYWTYSMEQVWEGLAACYANLVSDVAARYDCPLRKLKAAGFSGMMHGYIAVGEDGELLTPFRTWRNNTTAQASTELTALFDWPVPQRWSVAHLYQAILDDEEHLHRLAGINTLAGYVHWKLSGEWVMGIGEASGMFPVDPDTGDYNGEMLDSFDALVEAKGFSWKLRDLLPRIVAVGENAGSISEAGAKLLDPGGQLQAGTALCPPEGDAGTGMVVTNAVRPGTGNVSAGTSVFAMLVLDRKLSKARSEIDLVLTPDGHLAGMAHSNNCTSDFDAWAGLLGEAARLLGAEFDHDKLFGTLLPLALEADEDCGGLLTYGYVSGEHLTGFSEGRPLVVRKPDGAFTLANFVRAHLFSALGALRIGLDVLTRDEGVEVRQLCGHGGFFKTPQVGQRIMAAATNTPVSVCSGAGEGGAWGMALLAAYSVRENTQESLADYLDRLIGDSVSQAVQPRADEVASFEDYFKRYKGGLAIEEAAVNSQSAA